MPSSDRPPVLLHAPATPTAPALVLRPWRAEDADALLDAHRDPALRRWLATHLDSEADGLRWLRAQDRGWAAGDRFGFAVLEAATGAAPPRLAGNVVLKGAAPGAPSAEVGYWTVAWARGRGVAPRALAALTAWACDVFGGDDGVRRLELLHQEDNAASCRVAEKSGYALESVLPPAPPAYPRPGHLHVRHVAG